MRVMVQTTHGTVELDRPDVFESRPDYEAIVQMFHCCLYSLGLDDDAIKALMRNKYELEDLPSKYPEGYDPLICRCCGDKMEEDDLECSTCGGACCDICGEPHELVRPGKTQPSCGCRD